MKEIEDAEPIINNIPKLKTTDLILPETPKIKH